VLAHAAAAPKVRTVRESRSHSKPRGANVTKEPGETRARRDTTEGIPIAVLPPCKGRWNGGLGHTGQRGVHVARRALRQLPVGPGTGYAVPAATTRDVRDRDVRGEGCSSR